MTLNILVQFLNLFCIFRFNIQSGLWRDSYGVDLVHGNPVRGVAVHQLNEVTVTGSMKGMVNFWRFKCNGKKHSFIRKIEIEQKPSKSSTNCALDVLIIALIEIISAVTFLSEVFSIHNCFYSF